MYRMHQTISRQKHNPQIAVSLDSMQSHFGILPPQRKPPLSTGRIRAARQHIVFLSCKSITFIGRLLRPGSLPPNKDRPGSELASEEDMSTCSVVFCLELSYCSRCLLNKGKEGSNSRNLRIANPLANQKLNLLEA